MIGSEKERETNTGFRTITGTLFGFEGKLEIESWIDHSGIPRLDRVKGFVENGIYCRKFTCLKLDSNEQNTVTQSGSVRCSYSYCRPDWQWISKELLHPAR